VNQGIRDRFIGAWRLASLEEEAAAIMAEVVRLEQAAGLVV